MSKKKLKVAFFHPDLGIGGAERLIIDIAVALSSAGHEVTFYTNHCDPNHAFEEIKNEQFPVIVSGDWLPRSIFGKCQALCAYIRMVYLALVYLLFFNFGDVDVYYVDQIPVAIPFLKWTKKRIIYYCHHPDLKASLPGGRLKQLYRLPIDWVEYKCCSFADVLLVNSAYTASVFKQTFPKVEKSLQILYPTIAESYQNAVAQMQEPNTIADLVPELDNCNNSDIVFLSINRFHPAKNLQLAIDALDHLKTQISADDFKKAFLILAGGYDPLSEINSWYFTQLITRVNSKNLQNKIAFLKSPSDTKKADLLFASDCLLYTPVNEHFGIVPLEAMACGKPVIACNSGGPKETVEHGVSGFLCEANPESLAGYMKRFLDKKFGQEMGLQGKKRLESKFSYQKFVKDVLEITEGCK